MSMSYVMQDYFSIPLQVHIIVQSSAGRNEMNSGRVSRLKDTATTKTKHRTNPSVVKDLEKQ